MIPSLRSFLGETLAADPGSVKLFEGEADRKFGLQAVAVKLAARGEHPALFFSDVRDAAFPCLTNLMGTYERIARALDCRVEEVPKVYGEKLSTPIEPVTVARDRAPVKDVVIAGDAIDLGAFPIPWHNEFDGGPYLTGGVSVTCDRETGVQNAGIYRHQIFGRHEMGMLFGATHHGGQILAAYEAHNERMPVAIAVGHHPAVLLAAVARLPYVGGEFAAAGALLGESLELVMAETSPLLVPAHAEIIIEGFVEPKNRRKEGPFGEWPGHYLGDREAPVMTVTCITHRHKAIFQDVLSAVREHLLLGGIPRMGSIYRSVKELVPSVVAVNVLADTRMHCYISLKRRRNVDVKRAAFAAYATEPENLRAVVVVDDDINVFNDGDVLWAIGTRFDAARDLTVIGDWSGPGGLLPTNWEYLADGSRTPRTSSAIIIDATKPPPPIPFPPRATRA